MTKPLLLAAMLALVASAHADDVMRGLIDDYNKRIDQLQRDTRSINDNPFGSLMDKETQETVACANAVRQFAHIEGTAPPSAPCMALWANYRYQGKFSAAVRPSNTAYAEYVQTWETAAKRARDYTKAAEAARIAAAEYKVDTFRAVQLSASIAPLKDAAEKLRRANPFILANDPLMASVTSAGDATSTAEQLRARTVTSGTAAKIAAADAQVLALADVPPLANTARKFDAAVVNPVLLSDNPDLTVLNVGAADAPATITLAIDPALSGWSRGALESALDEVAAGKARLRVVLVSLMPTGASLAQIASLLSAADPATALRDAANGSWPKTGKPEDAAKIVRNSVLLQDAGLVGVPYRVTDGKSRRWKFGF